jgi:hypothetical protein
MTRLVRKIKKTSLLNDWPANLIDPRVVGGLVYTVIEYRKLGSREYRFIVWKQEDDSCKRVFTEKIYRASVIKASKPRIPYVSNPDRPSVKWKGGSKIFDLSDLER